MTNQALGWMAIIQVLIAASAAILMIWNPSNQNIAWKIIKTNTIIFVLCVCIDMGLED